MLSLLSLFPPVQFLFVVCADHVNQFAQHVGVQKVHGALTERVTRNASPALVHCLEERINQSIGRVMTTRQPGIATRRIRAVRFFGLRFEFISRSIF